MDPPYHALQGQHEDRHSGPVATFHKPRRYTFDQSQRLTRNLAPAPSFTVSSRYDAPFSNPLRHSMPPVLSMSRNDQSPLLPPPQRIIQSQRLPKICSVCGRANCLLSSHRHYEQDMRSKQAAQQDEEPRSGSARNRSASDLGRSVACIQNPLIRDSEKQYLLMLWSQNWGHNCRSPERHMFPTRWIDRFMPAAMNHVPLFQALLAAGCLFRDMADPSQQNLVTEHLQTAIQMLSEAHGDAKTVGTDEHILGSILVLSIHLAQGSMYEAEERFGALIGAVQLRGGPHYLGLSGMVAELLLWIDHTQAVLLNREPSFKLPLPALQVGLTPRLGRGFRDLMCSSQLNIDLLLAADSLCRTTDVFELPLSTNMITNSGPMNSFGYLASISEYQLARCSARFYGSDTLNECVCLALILFNTLILRSHGSMTFLARKLEHRLWSALELVVGQAEARDAPPALVLWIIVTSLTSCLYEECRHRRTVVQRMRATKHNMTIRDWDDFRAKVLDHFLWLQVSQEKAFRDVWREVEGQTTT